MKAIAIITPNVDTFSNPTLIIVLRKLIEQDYKIIFFGHEQIFIPSDLNNKIEFHPLPFNFISFFGRPKLYRRPLDLFKLLKQYSTIYKLFRKNYSVKAVLCVDPMGLIYGGRIRKLINVKLIYLSFEIFFEEEFVNDRKKRIKLLEKKYSEKADLVIIQDSEREKILKSVNNFAKDIKIIHIPVSPLKLKIVDNDNNIRKILNIPENKTIVIYSGTLHKWSGIHDILKLFPEKWNNKNWLVIHTHYILPEGDEVKESILKLVDENQNISFHNKPFPDFPGYAEFLSGCDIGMAVYFPNYEDSFSGRNIEEIGLSSGKFSTYIMLGIPAITTSNRIYECLNEKYNFGYIINCAKNIPEGIENIKDNYEAKSEGCFRLFDEVLEPEKRIDNLVTEVNNYYA